MRDSRYTPSWVVELYKVAKIPARAQRNVKQKVEQVFGKLEAPDDETPCFIEQERFVYR